MKGQEPRGVGIGGELLEEGRGGGRVAGEQGLGHGEADAASVGSGSRRRRGGRRGSRRWPCASPPRRRRGCRRPSRCRRGWPRTSTARTRGRIAPCIRSPGGFPAALRRGGGACASASARLLLAMPSFAASRISTYLSAACRKKAAASSGRLEGIVIQVPQLTQRARLPGDISEPHLDRERFPVGILRRFRLARLLIHHAGLMPDSRRRSPVRPTA